MCAHGRQTLRIAMLFVVKRLLPKSLLFACMVMQDANECEVSASKHGVSQIIASSCYLLGPRRYEICWENNVRSWETETSALQYMDQDTFQDLVQKFSRTSSGKAYLKTNLKKLLRK